MDECAEDRSWFVRKFEQRLTDCPEKIQQFQVLTHQGVRPRILVVVPHGGRVDRRTECIGQRVADQLGASAYYFKALVSKEELRHHLRAEWKEHRLHPFHVPSHCLWPAALDRMLAVADVCIGVHGMRGNDRRIAVGGRDIPLVEAVIQAFETKGIAADKGTGHLAARDANNFVNRAAGKHGVQIEISHGLRENGQHTEWDEIAELLGAAVRSTMPCLFADEV